MKKQLSLNIPESEDEPKPWFYRVWHHYSEYDEFFPTKREALEACYFRELAGLDEWVQGVFSPDGTLYCLASKINIKEI